MTIHAKIYARARGATGRGWILITSANLSSPAWGSLTYPKYLQGAPRLRVSAWELGVLVHDVDMRSAPIPWRHPLPDDARYSRDDHPAHGCMR